MRRTELDASGRRQVLRAYVMAIELERMVSSKKHMVRNSGRAVEPPVSLRKSREMRQVRSSNTAPEVLVRSVLHSAGLRFRLHDRGLPGTPDIVLPRWRTVVLVHGCFWHRHKGCVRASVPNVRRDFWMKKFCDNVRRDRANRIALEAMGWHVIEIWECDVRSQTFVAGLLKAFKRSVTPPRGPQSKTSLDYTAGTMGSLGCALFFARN